MQKWQYLTLVIEIEHDESKREQIVKSRTRDGVTIGIPERTSLQDFLTEIGEEGWELCSERFVVNEWKQIFDYMLFKRMKQHEDQVAPIVAAAAITQKSTFGNH